MIQAEGERRPWPDRWLDRMRRRLRNLRGPVIQVWGWPGSGKGLLLRSLAEREGLEVPPAALLDPATLEAAAESVATQGLEFLLCRRWPGDGLRQGLPSLLSRPLLVFTGRLRQAADAESDSLVGPWEATLDLAEVVDLWLSFTDVELGKEEALGLLAATDGWMRPLELAAEEALRQGVPFLDGDELAALPSVQEFLEGEVLAEIGDESRRALLGFESTAEVKEGLVRHHGLLRRQASGALRPPRLLEALGRAHAAGERAVAGLPFLPVPAPAEAGEREGRVAESASGETAWPGESEDEGESPREAAVPREVTFEIHFFGPPQVWRRDAGGRQPLTWSLRRALKVFAYLLDQPERRATRLSLVEAAFADEDLEAVRRNFHPALSTLRRTLAEGSARPLSVLLFREGAYELNPAYGWEVDGDQFLALAESARRLHQRGQPERAVTRWQEAWKLYLGPYLDGYDDNWVLQRREALHRTYLSLLKELGDALTGLGSAPEALDAYRALLVEDPLQEAVQVSVMSLYAAQGRRDLVRRQYDRLSKLLIEELGVEPLQATTLAYHRLMG
ncbi:MAG: hypothetical protein KDD47_10585 [Acidobacteria bacterium]|nr:hypothetical protein [Acidobacteriota bacterium]